MQNKEKKRMPSDSILREKEDLEIKCQLVEKELPFFMESFFQHLRNSFEPKSRLAYLREAKRFVEYLESNYDWDSNKTLNFNDIKINQVDHYLRNSDKKENGEKALLRKRSILNNLFKQLSVDSLVDKEVATGVGKIEITDNSLPVTKQPYQDLEEVLEGIKKGVFLSHKEKQYWEKTKLRDYLILILFGRWGLLVQEVYHLDLDDIDWWNSSLRIYRKAGREEWLSLDEETLRAMKSYLEDERRPLEDTEDALIISLRGLRLSKRQLREITKKHTASIRGKNRENGLSPQRLRGMNRRVNQ